MFEFKSINADHALNDTNCLVGNEFSSESEAFRTRNEVLSEIRFIYLFGNFAGPQHFGPRYVQVNIGEIIPKYGRGKVEGYRKVFPSSQKSARIKRLIITGEKGLRA